MVILLEQLNLEPRQREAARLCLLGKDQVEIGIALGGIKQPAVSMLLARAEANAAAQGVSLYLRRRSRSVRTRSLSRFRV